MTLDPAADPGRRVWLTCTPCGSPAGLYLLHAEPRYLWVNCGDCGARYWLDSRCGIGDRPEHIDASPMWSWL
jgi:hypothetical protein